MRAAIFLRHTLNRTRSIDGIRRVRDSEQSPDRKLPIVRLPMTPELNAFIVFVVILIMGVTVGGFLVFANFLNREKERARRFRERHAPPDASERRAGK